MSLIANLRKLSVLPSVLRTQRAAMSSTVKGITMSYDRDPQPMFTDVETQRLLQAMTQIHMDKVFRKSAEHNNSSEYKFMTTEQLEEEFRRTLETAKKRLRMPPVVQIREDATKIISRDPALKDFSDTKYVFTDITYGLKQSEQRVIVRQTDGTLEYAPLDVSKRMRQIYFPLSGRKLRTPRMFDDDHLARCLDEYKYEFVLDRLTVQYEPYESDFHRISSTVYQHLNESKQFDMLRSTRHFGPMAFFYAWHQKIDDLLYDMIRRDYLRNGVELIALTAKIHSIPMEYGNVLKQIDSIRPEGEALLQELRKSIATNSDDIHEEIKTAIGKTGEDFAADEICLQFIESYIGQHALKKVQLELAVQTLKEINAEKKQLYEGLRKAHGVQ